MANPSGGDNVFAGGVKVDDDAFAGRRRVTSVDQLRDGAVLDVVTRIARLGTMASDAFVTRLAVAPNPDRDDEVRVAPLVVHDGVLDIGDPVTLPVREAGIGPADRDVHLPHAYPAALDHRVASLAVAFALPGPGQA